MSSYDDPPVSPDYGRREHQLQDASAARLIAMQLFGATIADLIAGATGATIAQRATYRKQLDRTVQRLAEADELVNSIAINTMQLTVWDQDLRLIAKLAASRDEQNEAVAVAFDLAVEEAAQTAAALQAALSEKTKRAAELATTTRLELAASLLTSQEETVQAAFDLAAQVRELLATELRATLAVTVAEAVAAALDARASQGEP